MLSNFAKIISDINVEQFSSSGLWDTHTTTNSVEAWHRAFSVTVACYHPTFWKFREALKIEQSSVELRQAQYYSGSSPNKSKTSLQEISNIVRLVMNYHTRSLQTYLQSIAYNVCL